MLDTVHAVFEMENLLFSSVFLEWPVREGGMQFAPGPKLKGTKNCKRGATKGVIKKYIFGTLFI
jgi:hypothetical protein